jgi:hypothetical protein
MLTDPHIAISQPARHNFQSLADIGILNPKKIVGQ